MELLDSYEQTNNDINVQLKIKKIFVSLMYKVVHIGTCRIYLYMYI